MTTRKNMEKKLLKLASRHEKEAGRLIDKSYMIKWVIDNYNSPLNLEDSFRRLYLNNCRIRSRVGDATYESVVNGSVPYMHLHVVLRDFSENNKFKDPLATKFIEYIKEKGEYEEGKLLRPVGKLVSRTMTEDEYNKYLNGDLDLILNEEEALRTK
jgi:hypothetical protein